MPDPIPELDALIVATAKVHGRTLIIHNIKGLQRDDVDVLGSRQL